MGIGCRINDKEKCASCAYSIPEATQKYLIRCSLGRGVLRTRDSWCETWTERNPYEILRGITEWKIKW